MLLPATDLAALGTDAQVAGTVCMWTAVLLRLPHALGSRQQRELWLACLAAAAATTLDLDGVGDFVDRNSGSAHSVDLVRNVCGLISAFALLELVHSLAAGSRSRTLLRWLRVTACCVVVGAVALDTLHSPHGRHLILEGPSPTPSPPYWLLIIGTHLIANTLCLAVCVRRGRRSGNRSLTAALLLLGSGTAMAGVFWLGALSQLLGSAWSVPIQPFALALHGLLVAAALTVPTTRAARRALTDLGHLWRIWPLWRDLVEVCPQVLLAPRRSRLMEALWPQGPRRLLLYRKLMEIRDAILVLDQYATPELHSRARAFADTVSDGVPAHPYDGDTRAAAPPAEEHSAAVLAAVLKGARAAHLTGGEPRRDTPPIAPIGADTLADETTFLLTVARIYRSAPTSVHPHTPVPEEAPR
ncbi:MAB_1171c family putative transporter [Streptomyces formicae]|uniref:RacC protein n=1 Tax=Streptomyces formicae TaxID=1616117 RepID=A0A291Q0M1_9ACTN|nr:MAB_1171c family putative transporter [Streptomyces formicae]ATL25047.1 hypothetical protein KY5_0029 [Streptomyces formicae]ATL33152.1 RacC protein [Streptomyces formicae]